MCCQGDPGTNLGAGHDADQLYTKEKEGHCYITFHIRVI